MTLRWFKALNLSPYLSYVLCQCRLVNRAIVSLVSHTTSFKFWYRDQMIKTISMNHVTLAAK